MFAYKSKNKNIKFKYKTSTATDEVMIIIIVSNNGRNVRIDVPTYRQSIIGFVVLVVICAEEQQAAPAAPVAHFVPVSWAKCDDQMWAAGQFDLNGGAQTAALSL